MKKVLLAFTFCSLAFATTKANDTLTRAQVYNFNVGDTFEYRYTTENTDMGIPLTISYGRIVLKQKTFSANLDTLFLGYGAPGDTIIYQHETITELDSFPILQISNGGDATCVMTYTFDSTTYPGYVSNSLELSCFESGQDYRYTKGLGRTLHSVGGVGNTGFGTVYSSEELIYYSNGTTHVGTPYVYVPPTPFPVRYIPLPETCAVWTRTIYGSYSGATPFGTITEQIHTGNRIYKGGKTYVELICRIQNDITHHFTPDSLIGYFYNDSANLSARFVTDTNSPTYFLCSFTGQPGQQCSRNGYFSVDSVLIGGIYRTYWSCSGNEDCNDAKISGIGELSGLIPINHLYNSLGQGHETCGSLTCFCVCGQKLYPTNTASTCDLLSGIPQSVIDNPQFAISPNPATNSVTISIDENMIGSIATVTDITGRKMAAVPLSSANCHLSTADFANGIYFVTLTTPDGRSATKKLVKQYASG